MYFYQEDTDPHEQRKQAGLCEGVIEFMKAFVTEDDDYDSNPVETVSTTMFTITVKEVFEGIYLCLIVTHENLYSDNVQENESVTISNYTQKQSMFREEDSGIFKSTLQLYYDMF